MITPGIIPTKTELQEEVDRLRADNAALRADKERLVNAGTLLAQIAKHAPKPAFCLTSQVRHAVNLTHAISNEQRPGVVCNCWLGAFSMGMFDDIKCRYPLPVEGANALDYQTKDTPAQFCDIYEIREDGTLWREDYDTEDHSDAAKWQAENPGKELPEELKGWRSFTGCMARVNKRWEQVPDFIGELRFYTTLPPNHSGWIEWSAYFEAGKIARLNLIEHRKADAPNA